MKKAIIILLGLIVFCSIVWADLGNELIQAAKDDNLAEVERLLRAGADVDLNFAGGWTVLSVAVNRGHAKVAELLKNAGAVE